MEARKRLQRLERCEGGETERLETLGLDHLGTGRREDIKRVWRDKEAGEAGKRARDEGRGWGGKGEGREASGRLEEG